MMMMMMTMVVMMMMMICGDDIANDWLASATLPGRSDDMLLSILITNIDYVSCW